MVYRVVGADSNYGTNLYPGQWWTDEELPKTEAQWRGSYAVVGIWNGDGGYTWKKLTKSVKAWKGKAGPQNSQVEGHVLPGGATQIWVPNKTIDPLEGGETKLTRTKPTPWNTEA